MTASLIQVPVRLVSAKTIRRRTRALILFAIFWVLLLSIVAVSAQKAASNAKKAADIAQQQANQLVAKVDANTAPTWSVQAQLVATDYLLGLPCPIAQAVGLPPDMGRSVGNQAPVPIKFSAIELIGSTRLGSASGHDLRVINRFLIQVTGSHPLEMSVVMQDDGSGPVLADVPSLSPITLNGNNNGHALDWSNYTQAALSVGARSQVDLWAQAWVTNNQAALYQITGDTAAHRYIGLGGWRLLMQPTVVSATASGSDALIQVQLAMVRTGHPSQELTSSYDLLMQSINRPLPPIVAWGPAGAGWSLHPYQNALPGSPVLP